MTINCSDSEACNDPTGLKLETTGKLPVDGGSVTVDSELSTTSENPVQNKVIANRVNELQADIDTIIVSSDVKDVVGTKADLDAYDTSTLGDNDIIKVLADETEDDAQAYYRYSTATGQFTLIGTIDGGSSVGVYSYPFGYDTIEGQLPSNNIWELPAGMYNLWSGQVGTLKWGSGGTQKINDIAANQYAPNFNRCFMWVGEQEDVYRQDSAGNPRTKIISDARPFWIMGNGSQNNSTFLWCSGYAANTVPVGFDPRGGFTPTPRNDLTGTSATIPLSANQGRVLKGLIDAITPAIETYTIADTDWTALASSSPYIYSADVTATHTTQNDTLVELLNTDAVAFANYGFAIGAVNGQTVTIYATAQPTASTTIKIRYMG